METIIKPLKDLLEGIKEIFQLLVNIYLIAKRFPILIIIPSVLVGGYFGLRWYVFEFPQYCIVSYYSALSEHDFDRAWNYLADDYRSRHWSRESQFAADYKTISTPYNLEVECVNSTLNPFECLFSMSRTYSVQYDLEERFTRDDVTDPEQKENLLWLEIANPDNFPGWLNDSRDNSGKSLVLKRFFKESIIVRPTANGWKIDNIRRREWGLLRD